VIGARGGAGGGCGRGGGAAMAGGAHMREGPAVDVDVMHGRCGDRRGVWLSHSADATAG
jgi:hypothetical protein